MFRCDVPPDHADALASKIAITAGAVVATLNMVRNTPKRERSEDCDYCLHIGKIFARER